MGYPGCPKCRTGLLILDRETKEPYCINCGWRLRKFAAQTEEQRLNRALALRQPSRIQRQLCPVCGDTKDPESIYCTRHKIKKRDYARQYMREKHGFKAWRPGGPGRIPRGVLVPA